MLFAALAALLVAAAPPQPASRAAPAADPRLAVLQAMSDEGARAMARLRIADYEAPYYLAYQLKDLRHEEVGGRYGAIFDDGSRHDRKLIADVRVGSYELDSSGRDDAIYLGPEG